LIELKLRIRADAKESRHESRAEIQTFEDEDPEPVPNHLLKTDQFVDGSLHHLHLPIPKEPGSVVVHERPRFFTPFSCQRTGNEVSLTLISTSDIIGIG
jgi:hypothetical protein